MNKQLTMISESVTSRHLTIDALFPCDSFWTAQERNRLKYNNTGGFN